MTDTFNEQSAAEAEILAELLKLLQEPDLAAHCSFADSSSVSDSGSAADASAAENGSGAANPLHQTNLHQTNFADSPSAETSLPSQTVSQAPTPVPNALLTPPADSNPLAGTEELDIALLELQRLLFNFDQSHLDRLKSRIEDPEQRTADISEVLQQAIELHTLEQSQVKNLAAAMLPTIEQAIQESVQRDETVMSNAIFPIVGPATRKAIAAALEQTVQALDQLLEYSLSPQALMWRIESLRSRRPFAEIVLTRTLQFRVEQIFLIHRETGLLLQEVTAPQVKAQDPELVSAMLQAIDSFVQDSFTVKSSESLDLLRFGQLTLWIEQAPQVILAAAVRGQPPIEFRQTLQQAIERLYRDHHATFAAFRGDATPFAATLPQLEACLQTGYKTAPKKGRPYFWVFFVVVLTVLGLAGGRELLLRRRWAAYVDRLRSQPGIVVNRASRQWNGFAIAGLRDPLAPDPASLLSLSQIDPQTVNSEWQPYLSLQPPLIVARAKQILQPPATVTLTVDAAGTLSATGAASQQWIQSSRQLAPLIPGVTRVEENLAIVDWQTLRQLRTQIEAQILRFEEGETALLPGQEAAIAQIAQNLQQAEQVAAGLNRQLQLQVIGRANSNGTPARNLELSQERADRVATMLAGQGIAPSQMRAIGIGQNQPLPPTTFSAEQLNRSVTFRVGFPNATRSSSGDR